MSVAEVDQQSRGLTERLARLRRRLWMIVCVRGGSWLLTVLLLTILVGGALDWLFHLPGLIRALFLVGGLSGAGIIFYRFLWQPLTERVDDLSLALRVENHFPILNDSLASTVQFLEAEETDDRLGSPNLRQAAVQRTLRRTKDYDFNRVIDARGLRPAVGLAVLLGALAGGILVEAPGPATTALERLAVPFGALEWPRQTQLAFEEYRDRIGRNELFQVHVQVRGVVPDEAAVLFRFDAAQEIRQTYAVTPAEGTDQAGNFTLRLDPGRVQESFRFQVCANDATSDWQEVTVLAPPMLVSLDGRATPQVVLEYPRYTDWRAQSLADGVGNIEAVTGTVVHLRAAADRPLAAAWIEYQPENRATGPASALGALSPNHPAGAAVLSAAGQSVWDHVPAQLSEDRKTFAVTFLPCITGLYVLHFEDETHLQNQRVFEMRIQPDPAPTVDLQRPSDRRDSLSVLPDAELPLEALVDDPRFAIRSVWLEARRRVDGSLRLLPLYDHQSAAAIASRVSPLAQWLPPESLPAPRLRPTHLDVEQRLLLKPFQLREGDILILQVCADDFDDVALDKAPGRSESVEIRIVSQATLEQQLNQDQARIEQEMVRMRDQEREAIQKVEQVEKPFQKSGGQLTAEQSEALLQAGNLQQKIRERLGEDKTKGLQAEVDRIRRTLRDNHLPPSAIQERTESLAAELDRLAREEVPPVEPDLLAARKLAETPGDRSPLRSEDNPLTQARQHQEEVEKTLSEMLARLEPWSSTREIKGEARALLQEEQRLRQRTEQLEKDMLGLKATDLTAEQKEKMRDAENAQRKAAERTTKLLEKMRRLADERKAADPQQAADLEQAVEQAGDVTGQMENAANQLRDNKPGEAKVSQDKSTAQLEKMVSTLEDRREAELDRLAKKLREAEQKLRDLADQQDTLRKNIKEAAANPDAQQREEQLKQLAREQERLKKEAEDLAKQLTRMQAERASQALGKAGDRMSQAQRKLDRGDKGDEEQDETLDRLNEARKELERTREQVEEELAREQLAKVADQLRAFRDRQKELIDGRERIQKELAQPDKPTRRTLLLKSLPDLVNHQKALGGELEELAKSKLTEAKVFTRIVRNAADAMTQAAQRLDDNRRERNEKKDQPESLAATESAQLQRRALTLLDQLLDALKPGASAAQKPGQGGGQGGGGGGGQPGADGIPPLAELKLLRSLQADVTERTEIFHRAHPNVDRLSDAEKVEMQALRRDQKEVADLLDEFTSTDAPDGEGDKP
jgi:hypothetical protein